MQPGSTRGISCPPPPTRLRWRGLTGRPTGRNGGWRCGGQAGCGKSHLLVMWAARIGARFASRGHALRDLDDMPETGAVAVDDADTVAPDTTLLHLLNIARDRGLFVLLSSRTPPARWPVRLPDLASRLRSITPVEIRPPDDDLLRALLMRLLADRQLAVPRPVQEWLLLRLPRSPGALREAVARLDQASLASGRAITQPLAAAVLRDRGGRHGTC